jgi:hypothetical protein
MFLLVGGLSGLLGTHLRSLVNFVNIDCYRNQLDLRRWWTYYLLRPVIGFVLGLGAVLLLKAELIEVGTKQVSGSMWWAAVAFLAGFGAAEFTERLRSVVITVFGEKKPTETKTATGS